MRKILALVALIAIFLLPINQAEIITDSESETLSLQWNIDFGEVYVQPNLLRQMIPSMLEHLHPVQLRG